MSQHARGVSATTACSCALTIPLYLKQCTARPKGQTGSRPKSMKAKERSVAPTQRKAAGVGTFKTPISQVLTHQSRQWQGGIIPAL
eukprot:3888970-Amphidinium_carterae.1